MRPSWRGRAAGDLGGHAALTAWSRKAHGMVARLAGLLALLESPDAGWIEAGSVRATVAMMNGYFIPHARRAFCGETQLSPEARALLEAIRSIDGPVTRTTIKRKLGGQKRFRGEQGAEALDRATVELSMRGYIRFGSVSQPAGKGRPPAQEWLLHPALRGKPAAAVELTEGSLA